jgi:hypothetical protein
MCRNEYPVDYEQYMRPHETSSQVMEVPQINEQIIESQDLLASRANVLLTQCPGAGVASRTCSALPPSKLRHLKTFPPANVIHNHTHPSPPNHSQQPKCSVVRLALITSDTSSSNTFAAPPQPSKAELAFAEAQTIWDIKWTAASAVVLYFCTFPSHSKGSLREGHGLTKCVTQRRIWSNTWESFFR